MCTLFVALGLGKNFALVLSSVFLQGCIFPEQFGLFGVGNAGSVGRSFGRLFPTTSSGEKGLGGFLFLELLEMATFSVWVLF